MFQCFFGNLIHFSGSKIQSRLRETKSSHSSLSKNEVYILILLCVIFDI